MGFLRQLTIEGHKLPKVPELVEANWYQCMTSTITEVSLLVILFCFFYYKVELRHLGNFF